MKNTNDRRKTPKVRTLTQLALLTAVVLVMAATPLGYQIGRASCRERV